MDLRFPLILDGATGTQLQKRGYAGDISAEEWVLEHPESILEIQRAYVDAGSQVLYTPTFSANRFKLEEQKIFNRTAEINRKLAALSKQAADGKALVAGDMAPTGRFLAPIGDASFEELVDIYAEQALGLEQAGVDLFVIETMMSLSDARAAVLAVRSVSEKPIFVTFTSSESGRSLTGTDMAAALTVMQGMGVSAFGLNCSMGPDKMVPQLKRLRRYARIPLIAKPNAGLPNFVDGKAVYDCPPERFVEYVPQFIEAGVAVFGGCCGTEEGHIAALKKALENAEYNRPDPEFTDMLPAATGTELAYLKPDAGHGKVLAADADFESALEDAMAEEWPMVAVKIADWADVETLCDYQHMINKALCVVCDDEELLEAVLRAYQGRALYEGNLSGEELSKLVEKYGLIV